MSITSEPRTCPKCGGPIPVDAPEGLCPKCLLLGVAAPTQAGKSTPPRGNPPTREELAAAFPHLEILEFIGQGGMGFVFKARQPKLDRLVALKILPQSLAAEPAFAERFIREGRMLARLNHPDIVAVHDFGQADGFFYLLMEFVDGVNLRQAMKAGRFEPGQALAIVPRICEALQYAHSQGVLHRDIKPENILLDTKGRVKIADFGIAKLMGETLAETALTAGGVRLGTPHYMAPEQFEKPGQVDHRADIYSLGVVFYEMLTGELPIGRFAPPSEKSAVDARVDQVVLRTLEKERDRRQQSAEELKTQVENITRQDAAPAAATEPVWMEEPPRVDARTRRLRLAWAVGLGLALVFGLGVTWLVRLWAKPQAGNRPHQVASEVLADATPTTQSGTRAVPAGPAFRTGPAASEVPPAPPLTKTVVLMRATNNWVGASQDVQNVGVWTDTTVGPGETLHALVKRADGPLEEARYLQFISWRPGGVTTSTSLSWFFGNLYTPGFGESEAEAAATQLRQRMSDKPLTLTAGEPLEVFAVTNTSGEVLAGYVQYVRSIPQAFERSGGSVVKPKAIVHIRRFTPLPLSLDYSVTLPPGYALWATANQGEASTHFSETARRADYAFVQGAKPGDYHTAWFRLHQVPSDYRDMMAQRTLLGEQFQALMDQGPIPVVLGEPCQMFALTNDDGGVYRGCFELVAPSADGATAANAIEPTSPASRRTGASRQPPALPARPRPAPAPRAALPPGVRPYARPSSRTPAGSASTAPMLDPATGLPVPVGGPVPPGATTVHPPMLDPATGYPVRPGATNTVPWKLDPATGNLVPPGAASSGPRPN